MKSARPPGRLVPPADSYAVVMASGILAVAARPHGYGRIALALATIACIALIVLLLAHLATGTRSPGEVWARLRTPDTALRAFTASAACTVLAAWFHPDPVLAWILAAAGAAAWCILLPIAAVDVSTRRPRRLRRHAHGAWLLPSVATSGLAVAAATVAAQHAAGPLLVVSLALLALALIVYVLVAWLIAWQAVTGPFRPGEFPPDSWILMGAMAITALAASHATLSATAGGHPGVASWMHPVTVILWIGASVWIPILLYGELWRVDTKPGSLRYAGAWWAALFPLGMYSAATSAVSRALGLPALRTVSLVVFWVALIAWIMVAAGAIQRAAAGVTRIAPDARHDHGAAHVTEAGTSSPPR